MIENETVIDISVQKALMRKPLLLSIIALIVGVIGIVLYFVLGMRFDTIWTELLLLFAIPLGMGLVLVINYFKNIRRYQHDRFIVNCYRFDENCFEAVTMKGEECLGQNIFTYDKVYRISKTKKYLFIFMNKYSALPVARFKLNKDEDATLLSYFKKNNIK